ncbi:amino acid--tRNA ligase-related protein [Streptacidiphilus jiangxiensis]|uniref:Lysyl-tRNA synthetase, class 2 n=1 Tax=Streptacidiphilus jiangxiensis TaxID=235985 RepID=A0A1H8BH81_STRJI|nr:amino acid--tRNA ligase-related protein [Streptacidiphilus jiangxiensis]SEM81484.1 lysyl-tRNA synthetase, class 2 [Streptacidiphilus jiangxiensis]
MTNAIKNPNARLYGTFLRDHPDERELLLAKARLVHGLREELHRQEYVEVATPILCQDREGAPLQQFTTTHPLTGRPFHLRHSAEDHLRRLAVTLDRVFDLGKALRAESESPWHTVEFMLLEIAARDVDLAQGVTLVTDLIRAAVRAAYGTLATPGVDWTDITVRPVDEAAAEALGAETILTEEQLTEQARGWLAAHGHAPATTGTDWEVLEEFMKHAVEAACSTPTVLTGFPYALRHNSRVEAATGRAQRLSVVVGGVECGDGGVKLRSSREYRPMVDTNIKLREQLFGIPADAGPLDFYADIDADPAADVFTAGLGVDRLAALCAGRNVHEVLTFPYH